MNMATKVTVVEELVDDLDGGKADTSVTFALDGTTYSIDLSNKNAAKLRDAFAPWVGHAQKVGKAAKAVARKGVRTTVGPDPATVRKWAASNGHKVNPRGRIPATVTEAFLAAN
jgi:hypothetical protein